MADFCRQCSIALWGRDFGDLKNLGGDDAALLPPDHGYFVICEGCGPILVNDLGECISKDCLGRDPNSEFPHE